MDHKAGNRPADPGKEHFYERSLEKHGGAAAVLVFSIPITSFADVNMQEGIWEATIEIKMEGMPFPMPPVTSKVTQCITKKDFVPRTADKDQKIGGNKVSRRMVCVDKNGTTEGQDKITYAVNSYQGMVKTKTSVKDKPNDSMTSMVKMKGRRLGACSK